jgi:hydroxymethylpyrimidine pyrophosphatase-like HAD family hydrolase
MRYHVLAADYDGTLAEDGKVSGTTVAALKALRESGRKLVMVTGRQLPELLDIFPEVTLFDRVVAENGALLYRPGTKESRLLAEAPPPAFARRLSERVGEPVQVGKVIVATWTPHEVAALELINEMGLELQVIFNKGAVMILPSGVNKALGLQAALDELGLSARNAVGVGDAENDHAFLAVCECAVAVGNALPSLKERADIVTRGERGAGIEELARAIVNEDLRSFEPRLGRHRLPLGQRLDGTPVLVGPYRPPLLFAGASGGGKSTLATAFLEGLIDHGYQCCIIDPEGDFRDVPATTSLGDAQHAPSVTEVIELLSKPGQNVSVSLIGVPLSDRPAYFDALLPHLFQLRARTGRPHWIVVDEAHHLSPGKRSPGTSGLPAEPHGLLYITVHPAHVSQALLAKVEGVATFGPIAHDALRELAQAAGVPPPNASEPLPERGHALGWFLDRAEEPFTFRCAVPRAERRRHVRKYATGALDEERSFFFRGPEQKLNLRAQNLELFVQLGDGVDDETWLYHLHQGHYSRWFRDHIKDPDLASDAEAVEQEPDVSAADSRQRIRAAIESRYTAAA